MQGRISEDEQMQLEAFVQEEGNREVVTTALSMLLAQQAPDDRYDHQRFDHLLDNVLQADKPLPARVVPLHRRYRWMAAAAVLLLLLAAGWLLLGRIVKRPADQWVPVATLHDASPGQDGAVLTLANGQRIVLDSARSRIPEVPGLKAVVRDGVLVYEPAPATHAPMEWNTMATPRGRQFQVVLPDGTRAWLNAASSIRYPVRFESDRRVVAVTGEVYFEVTKHPAQPFVVEFRSVAGGEKGSVEVLGTHFNINAHEDVPGIVTTLLEGSVKVMGGQEAVVLQPGEQVRSREGAVGTKMKADTEEVMAWKDGRFYFNNTPLIQVMGQLQRWYDVEVVYEGKIPTGALSGDFPRSLLLSEVLRILELSGIQYQIENKKLTISAK